MVRYRRNFIPGETYFFTVALIDRRSTILVNQIGALRSAFRAARRAQPFAIDAIVILPDHLHAILTLPTNDADFPGRWRRIKGSFSSALIDAGLELKRWPNGDLALWQRRFLGAHYPRQRRLCAPCRLRPFQSSQTWIGQACARLAIFIVSSPRSRRPTSGRLGG